MFGIGGPKERTKDGAIISETETWLVAFLVIAALVGLLGIFLMVSESAPLVVIGAIVPHLVLVLLFGFNLLRRMRGEIVYIAPPDPDAVWHAPTVAEDAEYDRNKAAGDPAIMAEVDGKWVKLKGKALEEAQKEDRRTDKIFMAVGVGAILLAILFLFGGLWVASLFLFPFGAGFSYAGYQAMRHG